MSARRIIALLAFAAAVATVAGCADASAEATVPDHLTFSTAAPGALTQSAKSALAKLSSDTADTEHGVVLSETAQGDWYARVLIRGGVAVLEQRLDGCPNWQTDDWWRQQIAPGDVLTWSPKGNDVCPDDVHVTAGAALPGGKP